MADNNAKKKAPSKKRKADEMGDAGAAGGKDPSKIDSVIDLYKKQNNQQSWIRIVKDLYRIASKDNKSKNSCEKLFVEIIEKDQAAKDSLVGSWHLYQLDEDLNPNEVASIPVSDSQGDMHIEDSNGKLEGSIFVNGCRSEFAEDPYEISLEGYKRSSGGKNHHWTLNSEIGVGFDSCNGYLDLKEVGSQGVKDENGNVVYKGKFEFKVKANSGWKKRKGYQDEKYILDFWAFKTTRASNDEESD